VLLPDQIDNLAGRFGFSIIDLDQLSRSIGQSLDPDERPYLVQALPRSVAASRARKVLERALAEVATAWDKVVEARDGLEELYIEPCAREPVALLEQVQQRLQQSAADLDTLERDIHALTRSGDCVLVLAPADKRLVKDQRRQWVLRDIFQFWHDHGPKRKYTSDTSTSERSGPLIDFTNAVVAFVTDPPSQLSGNTIVKELGSFIPLTKEVNAEFKARFRRPRGIDPKWDD
jgi:hypothetical protein